MILPELYSERWWTAAGYWLAGMIFAVVMFIALARSIWPFAAVATLSCLSCGILCLLEVFVPPDDH